MRFSFSHLTLSDYVEVSSEDLDTEQDIFSEGSKDELGMNEGYF